jgi:hypothetical protein
LICIDDFTIVHKLTFGFLLFFLPSQTLNLGLFDHDIYSWIKKGSQVMINQGTFLTRGYQSEIRHGVVTEVLPNNQFKVTPSGKNKASIFESWLLSLSFFN